MKNVILYQSLYFQSTYPTLPTNGFAQIRIFNTMNCSVNVNITDHGQVKIQPLNMLEILEIEANGHVKMNYIANFTDCYDKGYTEKKDDKGKSSWILNKDSRNVIFVTILKILLLIGEINGTEATAMSWVITPLGLQDSYKDMVDKPEKGKPMVRSLIYLNSKLPYNATLKLLREDKTEVVSIPVSLQFSQSELQKIEDPGEYDVYLEIPIGKFELLEKNVPFKSGGVYTVVGVYIDESKFAGRTITVTPPNSLHMAWMLPQYIIITMAEVMFSVTGLQFAFTQAPVSMKSLLQAGWLLSVAFGNLIVVIIKGSRPFERQVSDRLYGR